MADTRKVLASVVLVALTILLGLAGLLLAASGVATVVLSGAGGKGVVRAFALVGLGVGHGGLAWAVGRSVGLVRDPGRQRRGFEVKPLGPGRASPPEEQGPQAGR